MAILPLGGTSICFLGINEYNDSYYLEDNGNHSLGILTDQTTGKKSFYIGQSKLKDDPNTITIPSATSSYSLIDGYSYIHTPSYAPTYTFPSVANTDGTHSILLDVDFSTVQTIYFRDSNYNAITPQKSIDIASGDHYRFICIYTFGLWLVFPLKLDVLTPSV